MNIKDLKERLSILLDSEVITERSASICLEACKQLLKRLGAEHIEGSEMLFTHLPTAISRIERGEEIEGPMPELMGEVRQSQWFDEAMEEIRYVETIHGKPLPPEEIDYLLLHYTNVFLQNHIRRVTE
ncbi:PRD domain-containing protein [Neobacillus piezotolerans]|uniref:PRD domain-containing protein n=1 Tax=Neobacillus piezotolerans TaxID=2259171 RepID=A0A3D8GRF1_9BACI|nr:PRD domain-containing protein [Neobacillus piezotolerans]RDU37008.1 PRD domain-containing protein [Neobacillus piezotolerans]